MKINILQMQLFHAQTIFEILVRAEMLNSTQSNRVDALSCCNIFLKSIENIITCQGKCFNSLFFSPYK